MTELAGPLAIVAGVLAVGGALKLVDPTATRSMLATLRMPSAVWVARGLGSIELAAGVAALVAGGPVAAAVVAALYLVFAAIAWHLVRSGEQAASCGCFGRLSAPATWIHVTFDLVAAAIGAAATLTGAPGLAEVDVGGALPHLVSVLLVALGTWLGVAVLTVLPAAMAAARRTPIGAQVRAFHIHRDRLPQASPGGPHAVSST